MIDNSCTNSENLTCKNNLKVDFMSLLNRILIFFCSFTLLRILTYNNLENTRKEY